MNLHGIVAPLISAINPTQLAIVLRSSGYTTNPDGTRVPTYQTLYKIPVQVQELSSQDLQASEGLITQGETKAIYLSGNWEGAVRADGRGGDMIQVGGRVYLVTKVLENWGGRGGWSKVLATLQMDKPVV